VRSNGASATGFDVQLVRNPAGSQNSRSRLRIAQVAPLLEAIPPARYGGTEQVIATLTEELVARGHEVTLFASGESQTSARLVPVVPEPLWRSESPSTGLMAFAAISWGRVSREIENFDIVHSHLGPLGYLFGRARNRLGPPVVTTLHGPLDLPELQVLHREFAEAPVISISNAQRRPLPNANWVATVPNGIPLQHYTFNPQRGKYLAFLGRISPEKGLDTAIRVALRAGLPIRVAAREPLSFQNNAEERRDWDYYEQVVRPLFRKPGVEFIGQVGGEEKNAFLGEAAALLFPIRWSEPFGLVMPEALACGTPVLALRRGSVPEVIRDGQTGFIRDTEDQLVKAVEQIPAIDRACCRADAERRFSARAMADGYEAVYDHLQVARRLFMLAQRTDGRAAP
jgi:glycosyltransferase involved in cell wall biosynthesis